MLIWKLGVCFLCCSVENFFFGQKYRNENVVKVKKFASGKRILSTHNTKIFIFSFERPY